MAWIKPIRYDKKTRKNWLIRLIISGSINLLFILMYFFDSIILAGKNSSSSEDFLLVLFAFLAGAMYFSVPVFVISLLKFIDSSMYLRRLKKNYFEIPKDKKLYEHDLNKLPRTNQAENMYVRDSLVGGLLYILAYAGFVAADIYYVIKWTRLGETDAIVLFVFMIIVHLFFLIFALYLFRQKDTTKYVDDVDLDASSTRKTRMSITRSITILVITSIISVMGVTTVFTMTKYIYVSRYGHYDKTLDGFKEKATMNINSEDLQNGVWSDRISNTEKGENLSPELSFDKVEGAEYYFIYMVDESANYWVHWVASDVREEELGTGANVKQYKNDPGFKYVGPYPPEGSGKHTYTIFVYAMKGTPDRDMELEFDEKSFSPDYMYYDYLNISKSGNPNEYGNVIAYGYISGTYSR